MDASMTKSGEQYALVIERKLSHEPAKVWRAITEHEFLHQWFPCHVVGTWEAGAPLRFEFQHGEGDQLTEEELSGEVLVLEPERLLEFRWGTSILRCELTPDENGCRLLFSETLPNASWGARNAAGWEFCLENLEAILSGASTGKFIMDVWQERFRHYVAAFQTRFGSQEGPPESFSVDDEGS